MANLFKQPGSGNGFETAFSTEALSPGASRQVDFGRLFAAAGGGERGFIASPVPPPQAFKNLAPLFNATNVLEIVSTNSAGVQSNYGSYGLAFSPDGTHVLFASEAHNLVAGDNNNRFDIFVKNLATGAVTRVSTDASGAQGNDSSNIAVFLPGGDKVAFISAANNLVAGDTNNFEDIFIKDLATGAIVRASTMSDGSQFTVAERFSTSGMGTPTFSPDGTKMAFVFSNGGAFIYIKDLVSGTLTLVGSEFSTGAELPGPQFSPDGSKLLYRLHDNATSISGIYLKDLASGAVTLVSTNSAGQAANFHSEGARFSADGTRIVFASYASNLVAGDTNGNSDIFVKDLVTGAVTAVSVNAAGVMAGGYRPVISPDGTKVAFTAGYLMVSEDNGSSGGYYGNIVVKDILTGEIVLAAARQDGHQNATGSNNAVFSPDGTKVGFYSNDLGTPDTTSYDDLYVATLGLPGIYVEGGPAVQVAPAVRVFDYAATHYGGGTLSVAITGGSVAGDQLALALSNAPGQSIALSGNQVLVNGIMVGTLASTATSLVFSFNTAAGDEVVEWLAEAVRISSTSSEPTAAIRTVTFTLVDGGGTAEDGSDTTSFTRKVAFKPVDNVDGQQIVGTAGDDFLEGGAGADQMSGQAGNDVYAVDNANDQVFENAGEGNDIVYSSVSYALGGGTSVETLAARDNSLTTALALIGNELANTVLGNSGANFLDGGAGADALAGYGGDDVYAVDNAADQVVEGAGGGNDIVYASASYALGGGTSVELLAARDNSLTTALALIGNELANTVLGNGGANFIDGNGGADVLAGYGGDDVYAVDNAADLVFEGTGGGNDIVYTSVSFTLGAGQEIEVLAARDNSLTTALNLTGNALANTILGNGGANTLNGGAGADYLAGYGGADSFAFTTALGGANVDTIHDFVAGTDKIALDDAIFTAITGGLLSPSAFVTGSAAGDADDRIIYNGATGQLFYDADGIGAGAAVQFATLSTGLVLTVSDFQVI